MNPLMAKIFANALFPEKNTAEGRRENYENYGAENAENRQRDREFGQSGVIPPAQQPGETIMYSQLRSLTEIRRSSPVEPIFKTEDIAQNERSQRSQERRRSRSKSHKSKKDGSKRVKYSTLIMEQNTNLINQYHTPPSSTESDGRQRVEVNNGEVYIRSQQKSSQSPESPHVHFADHDEILTSARQQERHQQEASRESHNIQSTSHSNAFPDILDALSQADSHGQGQADYPLTGVQEYELQMLDEKRRKLLAKIEKMDKAIHNENNEIVKREVELTEVGSCYQACRTL